MTMLAASPEPVPATWCERFPRTRAALAYNHEAPFPPLSASSDPHTWRVPWRTE